MLVIKVELWPLGDESEARELQRVLVINDGTGTAEHGNYLVRALRRGSRTVVQRTGAVTNHPRLRDSVLVLVRKALEAAGY